MSAGEASRRRGFDAAPLSAAGVAAVRRRLLQRVLVDTVPRGEVSLPLLDPGPLAEPLNLRRRLDDALRAGDMDQVEVIRSEARRLLAADGVEG